MFVECDGGFFGPNCTKPCGKCYENEQCHNVNGSCLKGCADGYSGINCTNDEGMCISMTFHSFIILSLGIYVKT